MAWDRWGFHLPAIDHEKVAAKRKLSRLREIWRKTTGPAKDAMHHEGLAALTMADVQEITEILLT